MLFRRALPSILQTEAAECGLASLAMIANYHGHELDLNTFRRRFALSLKGATLADLMEMADVLDLSCRPVRAELEHLSQLKTPCILHWDLNHYVVLARLNNGKAVIHDPARGVIKYSISEVSKHFTGVAMEIEPSPGFTAVREIHIPRMRDLWTHISGAYRSLIQIIILSFIVQFAFIATPFFLWVIIDQVLSSGDANFLLSLALIFTFVQVLSAATEVLRGYVVLVLAQNLSLQMTGNLLRHLLRLPTPYFEKRFVGDILARLGGTRSIEDALTQGAAATFVDAAVATGASVLIFFFSPELAFITMGALVIHAIVVMVLYGHRRRKEEEVAVARAEEQSHLIESIRANKAVKLFAREIQREASWRNLHVKVVNASMDVGKLDIAMKFSQNLLTGLSLIAVIYLGAGFVISGSMTLGALFAFLLLRAHFTERTFALFERGLQFGLLRVHLSRLSDIIQAAPESETSVRRSTAAESFRELRISDVSFRYAQNEPFVLQDLSLDIGSGDFVAIVGSSGAGKSTFLKVLLGLYPATEGSVMINGMAIERFGLRRWRAMLGVVQQEDELLAGTISENISFFDPNVDMDQVESCARRALIHDEIVAMPMGYLSLVGDMGSTLSGGQKQRILLARALYKSPSFLCLDEGTANLDPMTESKIADIVESLPVTRLVIAHRPEMVRRADRVFVLRDGTLHEVSKFDS